MPQRYYEFAKHEQDSCPAENTERAFDDHFEIALLLALLNKGLLNQRQFDLCVEALKDDTTSSPPFHLSS